MHKPVDVYSEITQQIIAALEAGTAPWVSPWDRAEASKFEAGSAMPYNATTGRPYSGINVLMLWMFGPPGKPAYLTLKQGNKLGARVLKGSKGYRIVYADSHTRKGKDEAGNETSETYFFMKPATVFHVSQFEGLPEDLVEPAAEYARLDDEAFNAWVASTGAEILPGGSKACYWPARDAIGMPPLQAFLSPEPYETTLLHELGHWTGHKSRLGRTFAAAPSADYAREELVAEICAAFSCARLGIKGQLQHAEYIGHWVKLLKADNRAIFRAASAAQKACEFLFELQAKPLPRDRSLVALAA